jgi:WD40 repeat protein
VPCTPIAFSPSGRLLATSDEAGRVRIWNTARLGKPVLSVEEPGVVHALAFSSDGARLVAAEDGGVVVWSVSPAGQISGRTVLTPRSALAVAAAADGRIAAGVGHDAFVWSPNGRLYRRFTAPDVVAAVAFLDDGARVAYGGYDDNVTERDVASGDELGAPRSHGGDVNAIAVSPDGKTIASASDDGYVKLWRADAVGSLASVSLGNVGMTNLGIGAGGLVAAASREHGPVRIWTPRPVGTAGSASPRVTTLSGYDAPLAVYGASPAVHDSLMAAANDPKPAAFALWDIGSSCAQMPQTPCRVATVPDAGDTLYSMAFSKSGGTLATGTVSNLALWDVSPPAHPSLLARTGTIGQVNAVAFDPTDDSFLAAVSADGDVRLLRRSGHRLGVTVLRRSAQGNPEYALAFSPDGKLLAAAGWGQTISLWNMKDPAHPRPIFWPVSQSNSILSLAFSPDGRYLVAGDGDGSACVYDISSLRAIGSGRCLTGSNGGDPNSIDALAFERDGSALLASGRGQPVVAWSSVLWGAGGDAAVAGAVCRLAGRNLTAGQWSFAFTGTKLAGHMHRTCP